MIFKLLLIISVRRVTFSRRLENLIVLSTFFFQENLWDFLTFRIGDESRFQLESNRINFTKITISE